MLTNFSLGSKIASGNYGTVYKAQWNNQPVAVKILHERLFKPYDPHGHVDKFQDECKMLQKLKPHKNIVQLKAFMISYSSPPMLITELLECDLRNYIAELYPHKIPFPETVTIFLDVAEGLIYLHQQNPPIVHRDLATKNVLLTKDKRAKIADLGFAKYFSTEEGQEGMLASSNCGTKPYAAPETFSIKREVVYSVKIDIFSFGIMLMEVINSSPPKMEPQWAFDSDGQPIPEKERRRIDITMMGEHKLSGLVLRCIEDDSQKRPTAEEIGEWLKREESKIHPNNQVDGKLKPQQPAKLKIIALGDSATGKTSVIKRFVDNRYTEFPKSTIFQEFYSKSITLHDKEYCLQIVDTAGQEKFHSIPQNFLRDTDGVLLVFDLQKRTTFLEGIPKMLNLMKNNNTENTSKILVGNKVDERDRQVSSVEAEEYARELGVRYFETSAKTGQNIKAVFEEIAIEIHGTQDLSDIDTSVPNAAEDIIHLEDNAPRGKSICKKIRHWICG